MPIPSVKRSRTAEEQGDTVPPPYTEVKKTRSLSPGARVDDGRVLWSNSDVNAELAKGLGPDYVSSRKGPVGTSELMYLSTNNCMDLLNGIFGPDRWSGSILFHDCAVRQENHKWIADATAIVKITVKWPEGDISSREGKGYGGNKKLNTRGEAVEAAEKEAESDALKRAARQFGSALGNCLYDKDYVVYLRGVKYQERNKSTPTRWTAETLLRKPFVDDAAKKQKKLSFQPVGHHARSAMNGTVKTSLVEEEDYFGSDGEEGLFVDDDPMGVTEL